jgi:hypothetical protein
MGGFVVVMVMPVMMPVIMTRMAPMQLLNMIVVRGSRHAVELFGEIADGRWDLRGAVVWDLPGDLEGLLGGLGVVFWRR